MNTPTWNPADHPYAAGSGAHKLVDSAVAPLVGYARGMKTIYPGNDVKTLLGNLAQAPNSRIARQVKRAVRATDALLMPWYTADQVVRMHRDGYDTAPASAQLRPDPANRFVVDEATGREAKYVNLAGQPTVIGPHPGLPAEWLTGRNRPLMFTEGMLKADSALTSMLLANGATRDDLAIRPDETIRAARERLAALLARIPADRQVVVYGFVSVTTFSKNPEWNAIASTNNCYVAFDGDIATNPMVWRGADQLFDLLERKGGTPKLIDLSAQTLPNGAKCGMDDYLSHLGDWDTLLGLAVDQLPPKPATPDTPAPGEWRMNPKTLCTEEWRAPADPSDPGGWATKHEFVARVSTIEDRRQVTDDELKTGRYQSRDDARNMDSFCEIEVAWVDPDGQRHTAVVSGQADLMGTLPTEWRRITGTAIPSSVNHLPTWPPRDPAFMVACKKYRADETIERPLWNHMGWVPTRDGSPVFVVGDQVVGPDGLDPEAAASAVTDNEVRTASRFGVQLPDDDDTARDAFRRMLDTYRPANRTDAPWRDEKNASIFIAAALRPTIPAPCRVPLLLSGASGAGKALPMDARLPVPVSSKFPDGWATNARLAEGDLMYAPDGQTTQVRRLSPVFTDEDMYELDLDDGQVVRASGNHVMAASTAATRDTHTAWHAAHPRPQHPARAAYARQLAARAAGGDAATIRDLAKAAGVRPATLQRIVDAKGVPSDLVWLPTRSGYQEVRHWPAAEALEALAEWFENGKGATGPLTRSVKVADMAAAGAREQWAIRLPRPIAGNGTGVPDDLYDAGRRLASQYSAAHGGRAVATLPATIPAAWLRASKTQRTTLFAGIAAEAARVDDRAHVTLDPGSVEAAAQVAELARSLGKKARVDGTVVEFTATDEWLNVTAIRRASQVPCRCLQVTHPSGMFLTDGFVPTHNSWSSAAVMMFWQSEPGTWSERALPGSAGDTFASSEVAVSKTPIWVVDDLAPSESNPSAHGRQADAVNQLIRNVHNGASRARRTSDMRAQDMNTPRALLIVSAEQAPEREPSIMNRLVHVQVRARQFLAASDEPTDRLVQVGGDDGSPQSVVTGYILRMLARRAAAPGGWEDLQDDVRMELEAHAAAAKGVMARSGSSTRQAKTVADLALGLSALRWAVEELDLDDEYGDRVADMICDLYEVARDGYEASTDTVVGHQFMEALASALSSHRAHVGALGQSGMPVTPGTFGYHQSSDEVNDLLGWTIGDDQTDPRPGGPRVGNLVTDHHGRLAILFDVNASFEAVKGRFQSNSANLVWESAAQCGWQLLDDEGGWAPKKKDNGEPRLRQRVTKGGMTREGVVVPLWKFLGDEEPEDNGGIV